MKFNTNALTFSLTFPPSFYGLRKLNTDAKFIAVDTQPVTFGMPEIGLDRGKTYIQKAINNLFAKTIL